MTTLNANVSMKKLKQLILEQGGELGYQTPGQ